MNVKSRRELIGSIMAGFGSLFLTAEGNAAESKRPNIIYIFTDQQSATMMSCAGNQWLKTPAMDYIAQNGIRFERAYTANPVCVPARISMMTGRFPTAFVAPSGSALENDDSLRISKIDEKVKKTFLGNQLKKAGYDLAYGGKVHLPDLMTPERTGFEMLTASATEELSQACVDYIKRAHDKPYCLIASFINPHDICFFAIKDVRYATRDQVVVKEKKAGPGVPKKLKDAITIPEGVTDDEFFGKYCPPLPPNYAPQQDEPEAIKGMVKDEKFRLLARQNYTDRDWRLHRWAYHRLTEVADRQIQPILDALKASGQEDNTLIIFSSDHGDHDASHRLEHKSSLYEESARIPFLVMYKGVVPAGQVDTTHLISNGLDLLPTILDYAGIENAQTDDRGRSLRNLIEGKASVEWRKSLGVESQIGRMVVSGPYKYIRYDKGAVQEQLMDLQKDPYETKQFADDPAHAEALKAMRKEFKAWFPQADTK